MYSGGRVLDIGFGCFFFFEVYFGGCNRVVCELGNDLVLIELERVIFGRGSCY